ncbi:hypothetical protein MTR_1g088600 [Medicago truncatula]|uniref:Uncharacterized protein n=1 Tax=Medicago truncatula TaxID=3880 RepID=G7IF64_MEDTR|nr:hypothetical protein MTR_1g088600 [Medicago truncatula]
MASGLVNNRIRITPQTNKEEDMVAAHRVRDFLVGWVFEKAEFLKGCFLCEKMDEDLDGSYKKLKTLNTKNPKGSNKRKDQVKKGWLEPLHCPIAIYEADVPTKIVKHDKFEELRNKMGVTSLEHLSIYLYIFFSL